jgi:hypothetical protein
MLIMSTASFVVICIPSGMMTALTLKGQGVEWDQRFLQVRLAANGGPTFSVTGRSPRALRTGQRAISRPASESRARTRSPGNGMSAGAARIRPVHWSPIKLPSVPSIREANGLLPAQPIAPRQP